jgi:glutamine amidotransferase
LKLSRAALAQFADLADCGVVPPGAPRGHRDGWGVVAYKEGHVAVNERAPESAYKNPAFTEAGIRVPCPDLLLAHLRKASLGGIARENTQPFVLNDYAFAHNGTVNDYEKLTVPEDLRAARKGDTDSEGVFLWLVGRMRDADDPKKRFFESAALLRERDYTATNIIFTDGRLLFVLRQANEENVAVASGGLCENYYTLFLGKETTGAVYAVCSERIALEGIVWTAIPNHSFAVIDMNEKTTEIMELHG